MKVPKIQEENEESNSDEDEIAEYKEKDNNKDAGNDMSKLKYEQMKGDAKAQHYINISLSNLDDPIVNALFISIINLMKYFCLEANINKKNDIFEEISDSLNKNNRETALFNCLIIPDDDVRLAVV